jgi:hypothetical protein
MVEGIYSILLVGTGIVGLYFSAKALVDPAFARKHVKTSPKVWLWRRHFGIEKTLDITRRIFLPLGIVISLGLITVGVILAFVRFSSI